MWYNLKHSGMQSGTLQSGHHHTVSFLSLFPVERLDFCEQILQTLIGCAFLPVGGILSAKRLPKSLLLDAACETSFWASVTPFSANPSPTFCRKEAKWQLFLWFSFLVSWYSIYAFTTAMTNMWKKGFFHHFVFSSLGNRKSFGHSCQHQFCWGYSLEWHLALIWFSLHS